MQYLNKNPGHQNNGKRGRRTERGGMIPNLKTRTTMLQALQVHTLEMLQHLKIPPLLAGDLVLALTPWRSPNNRLGQDDL